MYPHGSACQRTTEYDITAMIDGSELRVTPYMAGVDAHTPHVGGDAPFAQPYTGHAQGDGL